MPEYLLIYTTVIKAIKIQRRTVMSRTHLTLFALFNGCCPYYNVFLWTLFLTDKSLIFYN